MRTSQWEAGFEGLARAFLLCVALLILQACATRGGSVPYSPENFGPPDEVAPITPGAPRVLGPLDKVQITVFQVPDLSGEFVVDAAGNVSYPLLGSVSAQGKTASQLGAHIAALLGQSYLKSPKVQVAITEANAQTITVDGSVEEPGVIPIQGTTTLMRAVALAKGTSDDANPSRVIVFRTVDGERMAAAFDLQAIRRAEAQDPVIYGNDIVIVDGSRARQVFRDIISTVPIVGVFTRF